MNSEATWQDLIGEALRKNEDYLDKRFRAGDGMRCSHSVPLCTISKIPTRAS